MTDTAVGPALYSGTDTSVSVPGGSRPQRQPTPRRPDPPPSRRGRPTSPSRRRRGRPSRRPRRGGGGAAAGKRSGGWNSRSRCTCALGCPAGRRRLLLLSVYALLHVYSMSSARRRGAAVTIGLCLSLCLNQSICICLPFSTLNRCTCIPLYLSPCRSLSNPRDPTCSLAVFVASL